MSDGKVETTYDEGDYQVTYRVGRTMDDLDLHMIQRHRQMLRQRGATDAEIDASCASVLNEMARFDDMRGREHSAIIKAWIEKGVLP